MVMMSATHVDRLAAMKNGLRAGKGFPDFLTTYLLLFWLCKGQAELLLAPRTVSKNRFIFKCPDGFIFKKPDSVYGK